MSAYWTKTVRMLLLAALCVIAWSALWANSPAGKIVWWASDFGHGLPYPGPTNGIIEYDGEILTNVVAIAARDGTGLALTTDGTVFALGHNGGGVQELEVGWSNVVSIAVAGGSCWAVKRDGTVARWGPDQDPDNVVVGLSNITSIAAATGGCLALKKDGTVAALRLQTSVDQNTGDVLPPRFHVQALEVEGQILSHVSAASAAGDSMFLLRQDGTVVFGKSPESDGVLMEIDPTTGLPVAPHHPLEPLKVGGQILSNIVAVAAGGGSVLALRSDGTVLRGSGFEVPFAGARNQSFEILSVGGRVLSNIADIATDGRGMALQKDGTVIAWDDAETGLASVPAGLTNVIGIAQAGDFSLALVADDIPSSVYIPPHGRLEEMEREADLVFKGQVISARAVSNSFFPYWADTHAAQFKLISVLKGHVGTNAPVFWYMTHGPGAWGGGSMPSWHEIKPGQSYLVYAASLAKPEYLYSVPPDATNRPNEFRQLYRDGVTRTLDARALITTSVKEAHWRELNLLLKDTNPTNQLYAIDELDGLSLPGRPDTRPHLMGMADDLWGQSDDFRRKAVLQAVLPLVTNRNEQVAAAAIGCYAVGGCYLDLFADSNWMPVVRGCSEVKPECLARVSAYAQTLVGVADSSTSRLCRVAAIAALSCTRFGVASNSLPRWLKDPAEYVRAQAVLVLPDFPGVFCERSLRERAADTSPVVRAAVADAIGNGKLEALLPTLGALFSASPVQTDSGPWPHKGLQGDGYFTEIGASDIHSSAGYALLKFDMKQVDAILRTNLTDKAFGLRFIRKLAADGAEPYIPLLAKELKTHTAGSEQEAAKNGFHWPLSYWLDWNYGWAWETMFAYVSAQTREALAAPQMVPILDALQIADDPGDPRTRSLYGFFLDKGMIERALALRRGIIRRTEDKAIDKKSFNFPALLKSFDEMDEKHSLKPGLNAVR